MNKQVIRRRRVPALSLLSLALAGALVMPAFAADPPCPDGDADTSQGIEDSEGATGENTTCHPTASAYAKTPVLTDAQQQRIRASNMCVAI